jgi:glutamate dehydrogenase (NAD(P)+)
LDIPDLIALKREGRSLMDYPAGEKLDPDAIVDVPCDIWIPAARPDVLNAGNIARLRTKIVAQGANIPATPDAETALHAAGVLVLPDFIANAGGVICAATEYHGGNEASAFAAIAEKIGRNTRTMLENATRAGIAPRAAAIAMAEARIREASAARRWG